jgi:membrane associated rhomboid family serine protease
MSQGTYLVRRTRNPLSGMNVTLQLIIVNVILFIVFLILMGNGTLSVDSVAIKPANILEGKYLWTFLTSMFMHAGFFHIFVNMFSLLFVGSLVERLIGGKRYFWFYMLAGIFSGLLFVLSALVFPSDLNAYAVGASGALFGIVGFLVIITPNLPVYAMFIPIPIKMKYAGPGLLVILWLISLSPVVFGGEQLPIGNTAHFGGLIVGLLYGFYIKNKYKRKASVISRYFS